jgi:peptide chain release factor 2
VEEIKIILNDLKNRIDKAEDIIDIDKKKEKLILLKKESSKPDFWDNDDAPLVMKKIGNLEKTVSLWSNIQKDVNDLLEIADIIKSSDIQIKEEIIKKTYDLQANFDKIEFQLLLAGQYDENNAFLSIYAGAGGTDAQDWTEMLLRMYKKFCDTHDFMAKIIAISEGEEVGIKSVTLYIKGDYAYGYLKGEAGVHRLVRISPFDADKARHTSFALVDVIPEIPNLSHKINEKDLRIETFRAGGHGGQSVNTTDSAIRITHIPTKISATCQNERSQLQNKQSALHILYSKLAAFEEKKRKEKIEELRGESISAEWGHQIRSYVLQPYTKVKDHRTGWETSNPDLILNGEIDDFIEQYLRKEAMPENKENNTLDQDV